MTCVSQSLSSTCNGNNAEKGAYLKATVKARFPTAGAPKVMQRTSAVGHWTAAHVAAMVAIEPPMQNPTQTIRRGAMCPAIRVTPPL